MLVEVGCLSLEDLLSDKFSSYLNPVQILHVKYLKNGNWFIKRDDAHNVLVSTTFTRLLVKLCSPYIFSQEFCRETLGPSYEMSLVGE